MYMDTYIYVCVHVTRIVLYLILDGIEHTIGL